MTTVNTIAALLSINPASSNEVYVAGYYSAGDLGGGEFYFDSGSSATCMLSKKVDSLVVESFVV